MNGIKTENPAFGGIFGSQKTKNHGEFLVLLHGTRTAGIILKKIIYLPFYF